HSRRRCRHRRSCRLGRGSPGRSGRIQHARPTRQSRVAVASHFTVESTDKLVLRFGISTMLAKTTVAVLGATGSIGRAALDVVESLGVPWRVSGLSAHKQLFDLVELSQQFHPELVVLACAESAEQFDSAALPAGVRHLVGSDGLIALAEMPEVDTVVAAVVGS